MHIFLLIYVAKDKILSVNHLHTHPRKYSHVVGVTMISARYIRHCNKQPGELKEIMKSLRLNSKNYKKNPLAFQCNE